MPKRAILAAALALGLASPASAQTAMNPLLVPTNSFRRMSEPTQIAVGPTAQATMIPRARQIDPQSGLPLGSFYIVNPNQTYVRLKGFNSEADCNSIGVTASTGWLWPPGHAAVYGTQTPACVSAMAVPMPGFPLTGSYAPLELSYGFGQ